MMRRMPAYQQGLVVVIRPLCMLFKQLGVLGLEPVVAVSKRRVLHLQARMFALDPAEIACNKQKQRGCKLTQKP